MPPIEQVYVAQLEIQDEVRQDMRTISAQMYEQMAALIREDQGSQQVKAMASNTIIQIAEAEAGIEQLTADIDAVQELVTTPVNSDVAPLHSAIAANNKAIVDIVAQLNTIYESCEDIKDTLQLLSDVTEMSDADVRDLIRASRTGTIVEYVGAAPAGCIPLDGQWHDVSLMPEATGEESFIQQVVGDQLQVVEYADVGKIGHSHTPAIDTARCVWP